MPVAFEKVSSKVTAKILLYKNTNTPITTMDIITHSTTSRLSKVKIDVEPKSVLHTSPAILADVENVFKSKYPIAIAPTENMAKAASPFTPAFCPFFSRTTAHIIVIGITISISLVTLKTAAIAIAPNATWDKPSPIKEYLFNTKITPNKEEHNATRIPAAKAYLTKG